MRVDHVHVVAGDDDRAERAPGQRRDLAMAADMVQRLVEALDLVERSDLVLVREKDVDVELDELEELGTVTIDTERVRERQRDTPVGPVRDLRSAPHRGLRGRR